MLQKQPGNKVFHRGGYGLCRNMVRASRGLMPANLQNGQRERGPASFAILRRHSIAGFCKPRSQRETVMDE
jgi:hypothetical protein